MLIIHIRLVQQLYSNIREVMITDKSKQKFLEYKNNLSNTYDRVDIKLSVNGEEISKQLDVFKLPECEP